jgi:hypothetical protein
MAAGASIGGYGGGVLARRLGATFVRRMVIAHRLCNDDFPVFKLN